MGRGRKPKPTRLKILADNPGKRRLNKEEPKPLALDEVLPGIKEKKPGDPLAGCPEWLDEDAKNEWRRVVPELKRLGILSKLDSAVLAAYCQNLSRWKEAERKIGKDGLLIVNQGRIQQNPAVRIARDSMQAMARFASEYGFTPSSRARLQAPDSGEDADTKKFFG